MIIISCGKSEENIKKELSERVLSYEISLSKAYDPNNKKEDVINEIKSFLKPGQVSEARAQDYYNQRLLSLNIWNKLKAANFEIKYEISRINFNEKRDEAKVTSMFVQNGINCRGEIGKELKSINKREDSVYILINGKWYRDIEKPVAANCE